VYVKWLTTDYKAPPQPEPAVLDSESDESDEEDNNEASDKGSSSDSSSDSGDDDDDNDQVRFLETIISPVFLKLFQIMIYRFLRPRRSAKIVMNPRTKVLNRIRR
jgi:hypothetical protein